jgi:glycosyltransferase involved in cell wall biosynthesis
MKVLYFHQHFSTPEGSTGTRSYEMAKRLIDRGHQVTMVCGSYKGSVTGVRDSFVKGKRRGLVEGIDIIEFELDYSNSMGFLKRTLVFLLFAVKSIKVALGESYDLVFATTTPLTAGIPGIFARWFRGKKFVFEVRDLWPELPKAMGVITNPLVLFLMSILEWVSYHSAHSLIGLSPGIVEGIANRGIDKSKISLIPNGCDLELFDNSSEQWLPEGLSSDDFIALFSGTHGIANGLDAVLDAAKVLKEKGQDKIKFLLIGNGKLKPHLIKRAKDEGLTNVIFHDPVGKVKLSALMNSVDIGMQILANVPAFYYGTSPNKFFDYLSAGLPVLNNYLGWLASLIEENNCGVALAPESPVEFAEALIKLSGNQDVLEQMANNAKELAKKSFDRKKLSSAFVDHLERAYLL